MNDKTRTEYASAIERIGALVDVSIAECPYAWKESGGKPTLEIDLDSATIEIELFRTQQGLAETTAFLVKAAGKREHSHGRNFMSATGTEDLMQVISDLCDAFKFACAERRLAPSGQQPALQFH